jgi:hypothetical protein
MVFNTVVLRVAMLSVVYAKCSKQAQMTLSITHNSQHNNENVTHHNGTQYCYAECCYAECRYAECHYAECRGA